MSYKGVLTAIALAFAGTAFAAPNETFDGASQADRSYYEHDYLAAVDEWDRKRRSLFEEGFHNNRPWTSGFVFGSVWHPGQDGPAIQNITAPVPEPETYALMAGGLLVLAAVVRRRRGRR